jgi:hypothetical protein
MMWEVESQVRYFLNIYPSRSPEQEGRRLSWQFPAPTCLYNWSYGYNGLCLCPLTSPSISGTHISPAGVTQTFIYGESGPLVVLAKLGSSHLYIKCNVYFLIILIYWRRVGCMCHNPFVEVRGQLVRELALWFYLVGSGHQNQIAWLGAKHLLWAEWSWRLKLYFTIFIYSKPSVAVECGQWPSSAAVPSILQSSLQRLY